MAASESTKKALNNYFEREAKKSLRRPRKNMKPEKKVEAECMAWMRDQGWDVAVYEAKNTYNPFAGRWIGKSMKTGTVDCQGLMPDGIFVAVEFKAPGRLSTFNGPRSDKQREYLIGKINHNAFGCVVDSALLLSQIYQSWINEKDPVARKYLLLDALP